MMDDLLQSLNAFLRGFPDKWLAFVLVVIMAGLLVYAHHTAPDSNIAKVFEHALETVLGVEVGMLTTARQAWTKKNGGSNGTPAPNTPAVPADTSEQKPVA